MIEIIMLFIMITIVIIAMFLGLKGDTTLREIIIGASDKRLLCRNCKAKCVIVCGTSDNRVETVKENLLKYCYKSSWEEA